MSSVCGKTFPTINPCTGDVICEVAEGDKVRCVTVVCACVRVRIHVRYIYIYIFIYIYIYIYEACPKCVKKELRECVCVF